jgi:hypothetical protein
MEFRSLWMAVRLPVGGFALFHVSAGWSRTDAFTTETGDFAAAVSGPVGHRRVATN